MSATLDDMESYEFFQADMDVWLEEFLSTLHVLDSQVLFLHAYIEYVCFFRMIDNVSDLNEKVVNDFLAFRKVGGFEEKEALELLEKYQLFIKKKAGLISG
ncbi:hypothetical protein RCC89_20285 [Cytophagaceae bacterium ABcell3]|nr:hypothetical protein RCC89_20285 [Cytophagaceae bacterium ABcell3]